MTNPLHIDVCQLPDGDWIARFTEKPEVHSKSQDSFRDRAVVRFLQEQHIIETHILLPEEHEHH